MIAHQQYGDLLMFDQLKQQKDEGNIFSGWGTINRNVTIYVSL